MKNPTAPFPSNSEIEVLAILWKLKRATVREVYDEISRDKDCVYTSTLKTMQKMQLKGLIDRTTNESKHYYHPVIEESIVKNNAVKNLADRFFKGSGAALALHALGSNPDENVDDIKDIVTKLRSIK